MRCCVFKSLDYLKTSGSVSHLPRVFGRQAEKVHELNEEIGKLLAKAEQLGAEGNVDEAQTVLQEVERVRTKKKDAEVRQHTILFISKLSDLTLFISYNLISLLL